MSRVFKGENDYITMNRIVTGDIPSPTKKRPDYPEMPPQDYLDPETRLAVAKYMLAVKN